MIGHPEKLEGLHPKLASVVQRAGLHCDFRVVEGVRSDEQCYINYGKGRNASQCVAGGCPGTYAQPELAKVTWLAHALGSKHRKKPDGFGHAVDLLPAPYDWKGGFDGLAKAMLEAAKELGIEIVWGGSWKKSPDRPHFELPS
jgi:peptidoglycan L-alanyl-D-glutamate endopeptidase CwlK